MRTLISQSVQKEVRKLSLVELYVLFGSFINSKCDKDYKISAIAYLEKRINYLPLSKISNIAELANLVVHPNW